MAKAKSNGTVLEAPANINFFEEGHEIPEKRNQFMRFQQGANKFRFIGNPISGFLFFGKVEREDGSETVKPYRRPESEGEFTVEEMINREAKFQSDGEIEEQKYFVMGLVYNYQKQKLQVLEITQKSILKALKSYIRNEEYGHPSGYDITVSKEGEGLKTDYTIVASPPKPLSEEIENLAGEVSCDLEKVFAGEYPLG